MPNTVNYGSNSYFGFPTPFYGGPPFTFTPAPGNPVRQFTGGTLYFAPPQALQNNKLFDSIFGCLTLPYTAYRAGVSDNLPAGNGDENTGAGLAKAGGKFSSMTAGKYVLLTFTSQLAGLPNTTLNFPANYGPKRSQNVNTGWVNTWLHSQVGGWYYINGKLVSFVQSRDNIKTETFPGTYNSPGRLSYHVGAAAITTKSYSSKND